MQTTKSGDSLRAARAMIAQMQREMAEDPIMKRSQNPFIRGQREALKELDTRIRRAMEKQNESDDP